MSGGCGFSVVAGCHGCHAAVTGECDSGKPFVEQDLGVMSRLSRLSLGRYLYAHVRVRFWYRPALLRAAAKSVPVIEFMVVCDFDDNGRIREEKRGFLAFCAVPNRWVMILPYHHIKSGSERVFCSVLMLTFDYRYVIINDVYRSI